MKRRNPSPPAVSSEKETPPQGPALAVRWQIVLSILLVLHLTAILMAPLNLWAAGSPAVRPLALLEPYVNLLYLNHSYFFFAPNPAENHLVRYELDFGEGRESEIGEFPDRNKEWPRLLYHRHFMLSESLHNFYAPPSMRPEPRLPDNASPRDRELFRRDRAAWDEEFPQWQRQRDLYNALRKSIGDHLLAESGAKDVLLIRREHRPLQPFEVRDDRLQLTDPQTYRNLPEVPSAEVLPWNPAPSP